MKARKKIIAAAALAGLVSGINFVSKVSANEAVDGKAESTVKGSPAPEKGAANACKGQNECKGLGGCKSSDNGCKGKNSCKGKGGCGGQH